MGVPWCGSNEAIRAPGPTPPETKTPVPLAAPLFCVVSGPNDKLTGCALIVAVIEQNCPKARNCRHLALTFVAPSRFNSWTICAVVTTGCRVPRQHTSPEPPTGVDPPLQSRRPGGRRKPLSVLIAGRAAPKALSNARSLAACEIESR